MKTKKTIKPQDHHTVSSTDWLCEIPENIEGNLIVGFCVKFNNKTFPCYVRLNKEEQNWQKVFELIGTDGFISYVIRRILKDNKFLDGDPFEFI